MVPKKSLLIQRYSNEKNKIKVVESRGEFDSRNSMRWVTSA